MKTPGICSKCGKRCQQTTTICDSCRKKLEPENLRVFRVTVTIDGSKEHRLWSMLMIGKAVAQWSDPTDPSYKRIEKIEIEPDSLDVDKFNKGVHF